jgi:ABC-2 type transport system permease protein
VLTRLNPVTYAVDPVRRAVFDHLSVQPTVRQLFDPGVTWNGWRVPVGVELAIVAVIGLVMLGIAVLEFRDAE